MSTARTETTARVINTSQLRELAKARLTDSMVGMYLRGAADEIDRLQAEVDRLRTENSATQDALDKLIAWYDTDTNDEQATFLATAMLEGAAARLKTARRLTAPTE